MSILSYFIVALLLLANAKSDSNVSRTFKKLQLVPNVIPTAPQNKLTVIYGEDREVELGNSFEITDTLSPPKVTWDGDEDSLYTLIMTGPDVPFPQPPRPSQILHWLIGNIEGNDLDSGDVIAPYLQPLPPPTSDPLRYTLLVYKQNDVENFTELSTLKRKGFKIADFAEKHNLDGPVFGNFFLASTVKAIF
ncbi:protein D2-like [Pectinophora gossypiella]|uniref:protein D2-like n=1 Tax=Pectinophora gossypiella TaxID=13191 RepID=UPI00214E49FC|nr:protein D2-like [Pectinophora gossypiella]